MTIPSSRSLIFEVKSTGSELAFGRLRASSEDFGRLRKTSDFFGRLRTSSGMLGNDRVVFKNPSTPRIKISRLYFRKSWQVYKQSLVAMYSRLPITRIFKGNRKKFELSGVRVIGSSKKIAESKVKNRFYCTKCHVKIKRYY